MDSTFMADHITSDIMKSWRGVSSTTASLLALTRS